MVTFSSSYLSCYFYYKYFANSNQQCGEQNLDPFHYQAVTASSSGWRSDFPYIPDALAGVTRKWNKHIRLSCLCLKILSGSWRQSLRCETSRRWVRRVQSLDSGTGAVYSTQVLPWNLFLSVTWPCAESARVPYFVTIWHCHVLKQHNASCDMALGLEEPSALSLGFCLSSPKLPPCAIRAVGVTGSHPIRKNYQDH